MGSNHSPAHWVKDLGLPQMRHRSQLQLRLDPWELSYAVSALKKKKKRGSNYCVSEGLEEAHSGKHKVDPEGVLRILKAE